MQSYCTNYTSIPEECNFAILYKGVQKKTHDFPKSAVLAYFTTNSWKEWSVQLFKWLIFSEDCSANEL